MNISSEEHKKIKEKTYFSCSVCLKKANAHALLTPLSNYEALVGFHTPAHIDPSIFRVVLPHQFGLPGATHRPS
jgi:hypothetical protein